MAPSYLVHRRVFLCRPSRAVSFGITMCNDRRHTIDSQQCAAPLTEDELVEVKATDIVYVSSVELDSYAYYAGIKVNDQVIGVNGFYQLSFEYICELVQSVSCRLVLDLLSQQCVSTKESDRIRRFNLPQSWNKSSNYSRNADCHLQTKLPTPLLVHKNYYTNGSDVNCEDQASTEYSSLLTTIPNNNKRYNNVVELTNYTGYKSSYYYDKYQRSCATSSHLKGRYSPYILFNREGLNNDTKQHQQTLPNYSIDDLLKDSGYSPRNMKTIQTQNNSLLLLKQQQQSIHLSNVGLFKASYNHHYSSTDLLKNGNKAIDSSSDNDILSLLCQSSSQQCCNECAYYDLVDQSFQQLSSKSSKFQSSSTLLRCNKHYRRNQPEYTMTIGLCTNSASTLNTGITEKLPLMSEVTIQQQSHHCHPHCYKQLQQQHNHKQYIKEAIIKEGQILCKAILVSNRKATDRSWHSAWAVLHKSGDLFLCKDKQHMKVITKSGSYGSVAGRGGAAHVLLPLTNVPFPLSMGGDKGAVVQLALDYKKKQRVFRLRSIEQGTELLMHTSDLQSFCEWLYELRRICWRKTNHNENEMTKTLSEHKQQLTKKSYQTKLTVNYPSSSLTSYGNQSLIGNDTDSNISKDNNSSISGSSVTVLATSNNKRKVSSSPLIRRGVVGCLRRGILTVSNHANFSNTSPENQLPNSKSGTSNFAAKIAYSNNVASDRLQHQKGKKQLNFSVPLAKCEQSKLYPGVPLIIVILSKLIEKFGLRNVGVYRHTGSVQTTNWMIDQLNQGVNNVDFRDARWQDMKAIASTLKSFFSRLPECLFGQDLYAKFLKCAECSDDVDFQRNLAKLLSRMNANNQATLSYILRHFKVITSMANHNKVDIKNIAIIFGPTLLWHPDRAPEESLAENPEKVRLLETLLDQLDYMLSNIYATSKYSPKISMNVTGDGNTDYSAYDIIQFILQKEEMYLKSAS
ncbi:hypothetical protein GJ496_006227 [Pomphorhynchus laevis]|nr:hypothetical protein GJ496_006227 [Pomphorhynchus laevis]